MSNTNNRAARKHRVIKAVKLKFEQPNQQGVEYITAKLVE